MKEKKFVPRRLQSRKDSILMLQKVVKEIKLSLKQSEENKSIYNKKFLEKYKENIMSIILCNVMEIREEFAKSENISPETIFNVSELFRDLYYNQIEKASNQIDILQKNCLPAFLRKYQDQLLMLLNPDHETEQKYYKQYDEIIAVCNVSQQVWEDKKLKRFQQYQEKFTIKKPAYENCIITDPDGEPLSFCDRAKINWYLKKNLATLIQEEPPIIKLNFPPSGTGFWSELTIDETKFYTASRSNVCVICGTDKNYVKYHIVPLIFREHLPHSFKSHRSHDVLLLCLKCLEKANAQAEKLKQQLAEQYDCPQISFKKAHIQKKSIIQLWKSFHSYQKVKENLPKERKQEFKIDVRNQFNELKQNSKTFEFIKDYQFSYNKNNEIKLNQQFQKMLDTLFDKKNIVKTKSNKEFRNQSGKILLEKMGVFESDENIEKFIKMWRSFFLENTNPQFLPKGWSIDHNVKRMFGTKSIFYGKDEKEIQESLEQQQQEQQN